MKETEPFRAAVAKVRDAHRRAAAGTRCDHCRRVSTARVHEAEHELLKLVLSPRFERVLEIAEA